MTINSVLSMGANAFIVDALDLVARALEAKHVGLDVDAWYGLTSGASYEHLDVDHYAVPRSQGTSPWWHTGEPLNDLRASVPAIRGAVDNVLNVARPDVFLFGDDSGPLEALVTELVMAAGVPVVLVQHGNYVGSPSSRWPAAIRRAVAQVRARLRGRVPDVPSPRRPTSPGLGREYPVCSPNGLTAGAMIARGLSPDRIHRTGYPYFDEVHAFVERADLRQAGDGVLLISSGSGLFGWSQRAEEVNHLIESTVAQLGDRLPVTIRLKPGEQPETALSRPVLDQLDAGLAVLDDAATPSYESAFRHAVVLGEYSTVMVEAVLVGRPVATWDLTSDRARVDRYSQAFHRQLGVIQISSSDDPTSVFDALTDEAYIRQIRTGLLRNEDAFFHGFDGSSAARVAEVCREIA